MVIVTILLGNLDGEAISAVVKYLNFWWFCLSRAGCVPPCKMGNRDTVTASYGCSEG